VRIRNRQTCKKYETKNRKPPRNKLIEEDDKEEKDFLFLQKSFLGSLGLIIYIGEKGSGSTCLQKILPSQQLNIGFLSRNPYGSTLLLAYGIFKLSNMSI